MRPRTARRRSPEPAPEPLPPLERPLLAFAVRDPFLVDLGPDPAPARTPPRPATAARRRQQQPPQARPGSALPRPRSASPGTDVLSRRRPMSAAPRPKPRQRPTGRPDGPGRTWGDSFLPARFEHLDVDELPKSPLRAHWLLDRAVNTGEADADAVRHNRPETDVEAVKELYLREHSLREQLRAATGAVYREERAIGQHQRAAIHALPTQFVCASGGARFCLQRAAELAAPFLRGRVAALREQAWRRWLWHTDEHRAAERRRRIHAKHRRRLLRRLCQAEDAVWARWRAAALARWGQHTVYLRELERALHEEAERRRAEARERQLNYGATLMQALFRGFCVRMIPVYHHRATAIQCVVRCLLAKRLLRRRRLERASAIRLQARSRAFVAARQFRHDRFVMLRGFARFNLGLRRWFRLKQHSALVAQCAVRRALAYRTFLRRKLAAAVLPAAVRVFVQRYEAAVRVQRNVRGWLGRCRAWARWVLFRLVLPEQMAAVAHETITRQRDEALRARQRRRRELAAAAVAARRAQEAERLREARQRKQAGFVAALTVRVPRAGRVRVRAYRRGARELLLLCHAPVLGPTAVQELTLSAPRAVALLRRAAAAAPDGEAAKAHARVSAAADPTSAARAAPAVRALARCALMATGRPSRPLQLRLPHRSAPLAAGVRVLRRREGPSRVELRLLEREDGDEEQQIEVRTYCVRTGARVVDSVPLADAQVLYAQRLFRAQSFEGWLVEQVFACDMQQCRLKSHRKQHLLGQSRVTLAALYVREYRMRKALITIVGVIRELRSQRETLLYRRFDAATKIQRFWVCGVARRFAMGLVAEQYTKAFNRKSQSWYYVHLRSGRQLSSKPRMLTSREDVPVREGWVRLQRRHRGYDGKVVTSDLLFHPATSRVARITEDEAATRIQRCARHWYARATFPYESVAAAISVGQLHQRLLVRYTEAPDLPAPAVNYALHLHTFAHLHAQADALYVRTARRSAQNPVINYCRGLLLLGSDELWRAPEFALDGKDGDADRREAAVHAGRRLIAMARTMDTSGKKFGMAFTHFFQWAALVQSGEEEGEGQAWANLALAHQYVLQDHARAEKCLLRAIRCERGNEFFQRLYIEWAEYDPGYYGGLA